MPIVSRPQVTARCIRSLHSGHPVVQHLIDTYRINALLAKIITGITLDDEAREVTWTGMAGSPNLRLGGRRKSWWRSSGIMALLRAPAA
jgi:hypothetical protein